MASSTNYIAPCTGLMAAEATLTRDAEDYFRATRAFRDGEPDEIQRPEGYMTIRRELEAVEGAPHKTHDELLFVMYCMCIRMLHMMNPSRYPITAQHMEKATFGLEYNPGTNPPHGQVIGNEILAHCLLLNRCVNGNKMMLRRRSDVASYAVAKVCKHEQELIDEWLRETTVCMLSSCTPRIEQLKERRMRTAPDANGDYECEFVCEFGTYFTGIANGLGRKDLLIPKEIPELPADFFIHHPPKNGANVPIPRVVTTAEACIALHDDL